MLRNVAQLCALDGNHAALAMYGKRFGKTISSSYVELSMAGYRSVAARKTLPQWQVTLLRESRFIVIHATCLALIISRRA